MNNINYLLRSSSQEPQLQMLSEVGPEKINSPQMVSEWEMLWASWKMRILETHINYWSLDHRDSFSQEKREEVLFEKLKSLILIYMWPSLATKIGTRFSQRFSKGTNAEAKFEMKSQRLLDRGRSARSASASVCSWARFCMICSQVILRCGQAGVSGALLMPTWSLTCLTAGVE